MTELAGITRAGCLVPEGEWVAHINRLRQECPVSIVSAFRESALAPLCSALESAVRRRSEWAHNAGHGRMGVFLSGGVDSTLLALLAKKSLPKGMTLIGFTAGLVRDGRAAPDLIWAKKAADALDIPLRARACTLEETREIMERTAAVLQGKAAVDAVSVGVGSVVVAAGETAVREGATALFSGIGSEEIFAGYKRHEDAAAAKGDEDPVNAECWRGLLGMHHRDFLRDSAVLGHLGISALTPFLDPAVITEAMMLPGSWKIHEGHKKWALRKAAEQMGLPSEFAWRAKKAAQYGSEFDKALQKVARQSGKGLRREYLASLSMPEPPQ